MDVRVRRGVSSGPLRSRANSGNSRQYNTRALGSSKRPNLGRPRGSGSWASADEPLLTEMQELIESGKSKSPSDAALKVASRASGDGTIESKSSRLAKRYRDKYKLEQK